MSRGPRARRSPEPTSDLLFHVLLDLSRTHLRTVDVTGRVDDDALSCARAGGVLIGIGDEVHLLAVFRTADANAALPVLVVTRDRLRLGIGDVDHVVLVDVDAARTAELVPLVEELAVLIEDLHAVVVAIADEQPAARIHRQRVRLIELAVAAAQFAPDRKSTR